jgi:hypothetical protein
MDHEGLPDPSRDEYPEQHETYDGDVADEDAAAEGIRADSDENSDIDDDLPDEVVDAPADQSASGETGPENPEPFLPFRQPFDGTQPEIPLADLKAAGAKLGTFVEEHAVQEALDPTSAHTRFVRQGGRMISVTVGQDDLGPHPSKFISLRDVVPGGVGENSQYRVGPDGLARRTDNRPLTSEELEAGAASAKELLPPKPVEQMTIDELREYTAGLRGQIGDPLAGYELEERLGLRNQPVGTVEIDAVIALARRPDPGQA